MKDDMPSVGRHVLRYLRDKVKRCPQLPARCFKDEKTCVCRQTHTHMHTHTYIIFIFKLSMLLQHNLQKIEYKYSTRFNEMSNAIGFEKYVHS